MAADLVAKDGRTIQELAGLFIARKYSLRGIINKFGAEAAHKAVHRTALAVLLYDPENGRAKFWATPIKRKSP